ncbi:hypothetical protein ABZ016_10530 [Streptomyces sp. NPDC006372]
MTQTVLLSLLVAAFVVVIALVRQRVGPPAVGPGTPDDRQSETAARR